MAITKSAKKEIKKSQKKRLVNNIFKTNMKYSMNIFLKKIKKGEKIENSEISDMYGKIDKALKKNIIHPKNAANKKSLIMRHANKVNSI